MTPEQSRKLVETKTIHKLDYSDLERIIKAVYKQDYSVAAAEEVGNDSALTFSVKSEPLDKWQQESMEEFKTKGDYSYSTSTILQDLANNNYLPEGDYVIEICW